MPYNSTDALGANRPSEMHVAVYVASETALVRRHIADLLRARGIETDYLSISGASHPVAKADGARYKAVSEVGEDDDQKADAIFPYFEWCVPLWVSTPPALSSYVSH